MVNITVCACDQPCDAIWTSTKEHQKSPADTGQDRASPLVKERTVCSVQREKTTEPLRPEVTPESHKQTQSSQGKLNAHKQEKTSFATLSDSSRLMGVGCHWVDFSWPTYEQIQTQVVENRVPARSFYFQTLFAVSTEVCTARASLSRVLRREAWWRQQ